VQGALADWKAVRQDPTVMALTDSADEVSGLLIAVPEKNDPQTALKQVDEVILTPSPPSRPSR